MKEKQVFNKITVDEEINIPEVLLNKIKSDTIDECIKSLPDKISDGIRLGNNQRPWYSLGWADAKKAIKDNLLQLKK